MGLNLGTGTSSVVNRAAAPAQCQVGVALGPLEIENHFFQ